MKNFVFTLEGDVGLEMYRHCLRNIIKYKNGNMKAPIAVYINSPGGDLNHGFAIYDLLSEYHNKLTVIGVGEVSSSASIIMQAAHMRLIYPLTKIMVHYGHADVSGTPLEIEDAYKSYKDVLADMEQIYMSRCNRHKDTVVRWLKRDTHLNADQALKKNLIDGIIE